jgi:hypothetical protein
VRILADPVTGELVEVEDRFCHDWVPYDFREAKAAHMRASVERRDAEQEYRDAQQKRATTEAAYRRLLALAVVEAKATHGSTLAVSIAKGREDVAQAKEDALVAEGAVFAARERLTLCSEDREGIKQLVAWSRAVEASSYERAGA